MPLRHPLHLRDDHPVRVLGRLGHRQRLQVERLPLHRDVALRVGGRPPHQSHVDRKRRIEQELLALDGDPLDHFSSGAAIEPPALQAGIDERVQTDRGHQSGSPGGDLPKQVRDHPLRQAVRLQLLRPGQGPQLRHQAPMPADDAGRHTLVGEMVDPAVAPVPLAGGIDQREIPRRTGGQEALLQGHRQALGETDPHEAAGGDGVAVEHDPRRISGRDDLVASHPAKVRQGPMQDAALGRGLAPSFGQGRWARTRGPMGRPPAADRIRRPGRYS